MDKIIQFLIENKEFLLGALATIYELLVRLFPTMSDWSLINKIMRLIDILIPNRAKKDRELHPSAVVRFKNTVAKKIV